MQIKMLNNETINKIAAGEVIVRPVSAVKEMVENAIDAGATRITVAVENGGKTKISVTDDGCGIAMGEVPLAFKRHATSKISSIEDLDEVMSLGFRGEALASIAAVAKVAVTTRAAAEEVGSETLFAEGKVQNQRVATYDRGTGIVVSDLFYNTPARLKHMGQTKVEEKQIRDAMEKLALSHPGIAFTYISEGKTAFTTTGSGDLGTVIGSLYGRSFFSGLREINAENAPMAISGYIGDLNSMRATRSEQIFFVNGRYIKNKSFSRAFEEAYEGYVMKHKHPVGILFIDLPGKMLDVNIHPAKTEIRILNESLVMLLFKQGIRQALRGENLVVDVSQELGAVEDEVTEVKPAESEAIQEPMNLFGDEDQNFDAAEDEIVSELEVTEDKKETSLPEPQTTPEKVVTQINEETQSGTMGPEVIKDALESMADVALTNRVEVIPKKEISQEVHGEVSGELSSPKVASPLKAGGAHQVAEAESTYQPTAVSAPPRTIPKPPRPNLRLEHLKIVGQLFSTYILLEDVGEIILIDQHAAHEAFMYQELSQRFAEDKDFPSQQLLVPVSFEVLPKETAGFDDYAGALGRYGFDCDLFGETTLMVRSVPIILGEPQPVELLRAFLDYLLNNEAAPRDRLEGIIMMSCKSAVKANQDLSFTEIKTLLKGLEGLDNPYTCPHGRPIIHKLSEYDLKKLFKRVVS